MGLKGYRLWVMGQLDSTCSAPPWTAPFDAASMVSAMVARRARVVAVQVEFEKHILKPVFHLIGAGIDTRRTFQLWAAMGQGESMCTAPPRRVPHVLREAIHLLHLPLQARRRCRGVAPHVAFEMRTLKPVFSLDVMGYGIERL
jgi:hypothetical protein